MPKFCSKCGNKIHEDNNYCDKCGFNSNENLNVNKQTFTDISKSNDSKLKSKYVIALIIAVIIIVIPICGYYYYATEMPSATYDGGRFTVGYPMWGHVQKDSQGIINIYNSNNQRIASILSNNNGGVLSYFSEDLIVSYLSYYLGGKGLSRGVDTIDGREVMTFSGTMDNGTLKAYVITGDDGFYAIGVFTDYPESNMIVDTFHFK